MTKHAIASHADWTRARTALLEKEKVFTRTRDELSRLRRELPWSGSKKTISSTAHGASTLADLFDGRSQLVVYHFMFAPEWETGCKSCSFWADSFNPVVPHLQQRDVTLVAVSRAPLVKLQAFRERLGWSFPWFSSGRCDFNTDFQVSFTADAGEAAPGLLPQQLLAQDRRAVGPARGQCLLSRRRRSVSQLLCVLARDCIRGPRITTSTSYRRAVTRRSSRTPWPGCGCTMRTRAIPEARRRWLRPAGGVLSSLAGLVALLIPKRPLCVAAMLVALARVRALPLCSRRYWRRVRALGQPGLGGARLARVAGQEQGEARYALRSLLRSSVAYWMLISCEP